MTAISPYILLIAGFTVLIKGADFFVEGSGSIAKKLRVPDIIVGLTIVAMGTSSPELAVSVSAALGGSSDISVGNVVGSNLLNILIVLGISAVLSPIIVDKSLFNRDFPMLIVTAVILPLIAVTGGNRIGRLGGIVLIAIFIVYIMLTVRSALQYRKEYPSSETEEITVMPWWQSIAFTVGGAAAVIISGQISVNAATDIAHQLGISEAIIGLTVVALGTSLPELVTSAVAAKKGNSDMALGNIVGSNIFNVLLILGTTAVIKPFPVSTESIIDQIAVLAVTILLIIFSKTGNKISRTEGIIFLFLYVIYAVYLFMR